MARTKMKNVKARKSPARRRPRATARKRRSLGFSVDNVHVDRATGIPIVVGEVRFDDSSGGGRKSRYSKAVIGHSENTANDAKISVAIYEAHRNSGGRHFLSVNVEPRESLGNETELSVDLTAAQVIAFADGLQRTVQHARKCGILPGA